jgi:UDP-GlcNAc:undecaprenyl-phosphate GlcNAc-1-phosphate transferase
MALSIRDELMALLLPALLLSLWLTPLVIRVAHRVRAVDHPDGRKTHTQTVVRLGGLSIVIGLLAPILFALDFDRETVGFLLGVTLAAATGFLDDVYTLTPLAKFAGETGASLVFVLVSGISLLGFGDLLGLGSIATGPLVLPVTVFCMVGVMNALNLSDGLDGLAAGFAVIGACFLALGAVVGGDARCLSILLALLGSILGFLRYNSFPARLFMGDSGSLVLGFTLSALAVMIVRETGSAARLAPATVFGILALPIVDTLLVMLRRARQGRSPFRADRTHLHHRLLAMGLPHSSVVAMMYATMIMFASVTWSLRELPEWIQFAAVWGMVILVYGTTRLAETADLRHLIAWLAGSMERLPELAAPPLGAGVRRMGLLLAGALLLPVLFIPSSESGLGVSAVLASILVAALFPWKSARTHGAVGQAHVFSGIVVLLAFYHFLPESPPWLPTYILVLALLSLAWGLLRSGGGGHMRVLLLSPLEILVVGLSLFVAVLAMPAFGSDRSTVEIMLLVTFEAYLFLLAFKLLFRQIPEGRYAVLGIVLMALGLLATRELTEPVHAATPPGANSVRPAGIDAPATSGVPRSDP